MTTAEIPWWENPLDERIAGLAEFERFSKLTRLFRGIIVTEKIDGTNACIKFIPTFNSDKPWTLVVQSRNRIIVPGKKENDNFGFATWAHANADRLFEHLGYGRHYGEWFGSGISSNRYNIDYRGFVIFDSDLWACQPGLDTRQIMPDGSFLGHTPVLYRGMNSESAVMAAATELRQNGSKMIPGCMRPEGIVIHHLPSKSSTKFTFDNEDKGKWETL